MDQKISVCKLTSMSGMVPNESRENRERNKLPIFSDHIDFPPKKRQLLCSNDAMKVQSSIRSQDSGDKNRNHLKFLRKRVLELGEERRLLIRLVQDYSTAIVISKLKQNEHTSGRNSEVPSITTGQFSDSTSDQPEESGPSAPSSPSSTSLVSRTHARVDWKNSRITYNNGESQKMSADELEKLRRERSRKHAKLMRDRTKHCVVKVEEIIARLEKENLRMKRALTFPLVQKLRQSKSPKTSI